MVIVLDIAQATNRRCQDIVQSIDLHDELSVIRNNDLALLEESSESRRHGCLSCDIEVHSISFLYLRNLAKAHLNSKIIK